MDEFSIPTVKQETDVADMDNYKYPGLLLNDPVSMHYPDNGIYINPVEIPSSIPYKNQPDHNSQPQATLEKYPTASKWESDVDVFGLSAEPFPGNREKHEGDMLMDSLLNIDGLFDHGLGLEETNTEQVPQSQNFILEPAIPLDSSPLSMFMMPHLDDTLSNCLPTSDEELLIPVTPPTTSNTPSPPVPSLPPASSLDPVANTSHIDQLVAEIMSGEEWSMTNTVGPYMPTEANSIPSTSPSPSLSPTTMDDDEGEKYLRSLLREFNEPVMMDTPPPAKRSRGSESSMMSVDSYPHSTDVSPPFSPPMMHSPPLSSHDHSPPPSSHTPPSHSKPERSHSKPPMLFGQHEDSILSKLVVPRLDKAAKPITRDKLVSMPVEEFNALLDQSGLTEIEVAFMKEWRRRGKNKTAAQIARKRKRDELSELQIEIDDLKLQKVELQRRTESMSALVASLKRKAQVAENRILKSTAARGIVVSPDTHSIHVTDDGKTVLVPRISSQILVT